MRLFFLYRYGLLRDLHLLTTYYPTRRSSDLHTMVYREAGNAGVDNARLRRIADVDRGDRAERQARRPVRHAVRRKIAFMTQHVGGQFQTRLRNAVEMNRRRAIAGNVVEIGRASCRERVWQYV